MTSLYSILHSVPPLYLLIGLASLLLLFLILHIFIRTLIQTLRLIAILGLTALVAAAVWFALSYLEMNLGPEWHGFFFYRPVPVLHQTASWLKIGLTAFASLFYLWFLLRPVSKKD